jgi:hypothetical protein
MAVERSFPRFEIRANKSELLRRCGPQAWTLHAVTAIRLLTGEGQQQQATPRLPMRLDTGTFVSMLPEEWMHVLDPFLNLGEEPASFQTAAGSGTGRLACQVPTDFEYDPDRVSRIDWLVTAGLNGRGYGLLSLRDIIRLFIIETEGEFRLNDEGFPTELPRLLLSREQELHLSLGELDR